MPALAAAPPVVPTAAPVAVPAAVTAIQLAWQTYQQTKPPPTRQKQQPLGPRPLQQNDQVLVKKAIHESTWDEGVIKTFVGNPETLGTAWTIGPHTVLFFGTQLETNTKAKDIVTTCGKLWSWLGIDRPFTLVLWWREDPRYIGAKEWPSRKSVNGGWTSQNSSVIFVYRSEEWDRVFLHEMIHALGWDWTMPQKPLACWGLSRDSNIVPALFEAWTELYAEWLWVVWHADSFSAWIQQRRWQDIQAVEILKRQQDSTWSENTSVFAYYILKAALAPNIAQLLLFGNGNGGSAKERDAILCRLIEPNLRKLRDHVSTAPSLPVAISLRMSAPNLEK